MSRSSVKRSYDSLVEDTGMSSPSASPTHGSMRSCAQQQQQLQAAPLALAAAAAAPAAAHSAAAAYRQHRQQQQQQQCTGFASHVPAPSAFSLHTAPPASAHSAVAALSSSSAAHSASSSSSSSFLSPAPASKRTRKAGQMDVSMEEEGGGAASTAASAAAADDHSSHQSPFAKLKRPQLEDLVSVPRSFKKQAIQTALSGPSSSVPVAAPSAHIPPPPCSSPSGGSGANYHHQLFTYDQVASIVRNAVEMREAAVRAEYDATLQRLLQEQFESFSNFNKDYISRNMMSRDNEDQDNSYYS